MAALADIRQGLVDRLDTIASLNVVSHLGAMPPPPYGEVGWPRRIEYDRAHQKGLTVYTIPVRVVVGTADNDAATQLLSEFMDEGSASAVKKAIEDDSDLGGVVADLWVEAMTGAGFQTIGGVDYLVAEWDVQVLV